MGFKVPKDVPEWMKPSRHATETIEQAAKLQRQIDEHQRVIDEVTGGATGRMLREHYARKQTLRYAYEKAMRGATGKMLLDYSNTIFDDLQRSRRAQYAIDMVGLFSDPQTDDDELQDWIDGNRDSLTVEDLKAIVTAAMAHSAGEALSAHMKAVQAPRAEKAQEKDDEIRQRWAHYKSKGMSKTQATKYIAHEVGQKESTVRGKLKGI